MNVYVVGTSGSGKSTLAKQLAADFKLTHFDIDSYRFLPNWEPRGKTMYVKQLLADVSTAESWVCCGNYRLVLARLRDQIDCIIWLDYPFYIVFWRVLSRTLRRLLSKEKVCGDNVESWYIQFFTKKSIFVWVLKTFIKNKRRYQRLSEKPRYAQKIIRVTHPRDLEKHLLVLYKE